MKIICIGRNYSEHAKELGNSIPTEPVFFIKPDTNFYLTSVIKKLFYKQINKNKLMALINLSTNLPITIFINI